MSVSDISGGNWTESKSHISLGRASGQKIARQNQTLRGDDWLNGAWKKWGLIALMISLLLAGCRGEPRPVSGAEREEVLAYFEPKVNGILNAIQKSDFAGLSLDFDPTMRTVMGEDNFKEMASTLNDRLGACLSREVVQVFEQGYMTVVYRVACEKSSQVDMQIALEPEEPHRIGGIFFDAPELH